MKIKTIGVCDLSAWLVVPGVTWVQVRSPNFARKLSNRSDSRLVAVGVAGGYLRTFEFIHGLAWAVRLIGRYTQNETQANEAKTDPASSSSVPERPASATEGGQLKRPHRTREGTIIPIGATAMLDLDFGQAQSKPGHPVAEGMNLPGNGKLPQPTSEPPVPKATIRERVRRKVAADPITKADAKELRRLQDLKHGQESFQ